MPLLRPSLLLLVASALACHNPATPAVMPRLEDLSGTYGYRAFHGDGRLLLTGTLTITPVDDSTLVGSWAIAWAPGADTTATVGPQVGSGSLAGILLANQPYVDLNPGWADNNVGLLLESQRDAAIEGHWSHTTIIGEIARGRFVLTR